MVDYKLDYVWLVRSINKRIVCAITVALYRAAMCVEGRTGGVWGYNKRLVWGTTSGGLQATCMADYKRLVLEITKALYGPSTQSYIGRLQAACMADYKRLVLAVTNV
jgi:hypothetical protein